MGEIGWLKNPDGSPGISKNYVFGCRRKCPYGYCWRIAKRFGMAERMARAEIIYKYGIDNITLSNGDFEYQELVTNFKNFIPTFRPSVLAQKLPKKPTMIFFSMSDPAYWKDEWYEKILEKICDHMEHTFVILTKSPRIYEKYTFPCNTWLGVTIENQKQLDILEKRLIKNKKENKYWRYPQFLSIEPIQGPIKFSRFMKNLILYDSISKIEWVIVGPETGRRKNKIIVQPEWIEYFFTLETSVFMKEACKQIIDKKLRQEWPKGYMNEKNKKRTGNI